MFVCKEVLPSGLKLLILGLGLGLVSTVVSAANIACQSCPEVAYEGRAMGAGVGRHYVFDYARGNLRRYFVSCGSAPNSVGGGEKQPAQRDAESTYAPSAVGCGVGSTLQAQLEGNEPHIVEGFLILKAYWEQTAGTMAKEFVVEYGDLPPGLPAGGSAYEVIGNAYFRSAVGDQLAHYAYALNRLNTLFSYVNAYNGFTDGTRMVIKLIFPDGTSAVFNLEFPERSARYDRDSSRTPSGLLIPEENSRDYAGAFDNNMGTPRAYEDFIRHARRLGIDIVQCSTRTTQCTWDGHTLRCRCL